jgi:hypothetical protein
LVTEKEDQGLVGHARNQRCKRTLVHVRVRSVGVGVYDTLIESDVEESIGRRVHRGKGRPQNTGLGIGMGRSDDRVESVRGESP